MSISKGFKMIGRGVGMIVGSMICGVIGVGQSVVRAYRKHKVKRCSAYVSKYGYEVDINSRVKVQGKAYYVMALETYGSMERKSEVSLKLISVPQYKEIKRRIKVNGYY